MPKRKSVKVCFWVDFSKSVGFIYAWARLCPRLQSNSRLGAVGRARRFKKRFRLCSALSIAVIAFSRARAFFCETLLLPFPPFAFAVLGSLSLDNGSFPSLGGDRIERQPIEWGIILADTITEGK
jgi:hypothetical protein